ncbi:MAG TPA: hypothetical protein VGL20_12730 [Candidatus Dormibacteraeota bacterium]
MRTARIAAILAIPTISCAACGGGSGVPATSSPTAAASLPPGTPSGTRPSSPATLSITSPADGSTVTGSTVHVAVDLQGAQVVQATSSNISPDKGHVHLYIDGNLQYMQYTLAQDFPVHPGVYTIKAEFVASDHFPFSPRVYSKQIVFTVK